MKVSKLMVAALTAALAFTAAAQSGELRQRPGDAAGASGLAMDGMAQGMIGQAMMGQGVVGTVAAVAADHYAVKTIEGVRYAVDFSVNTRIFRQPPPSAGQHGGQSQEPGFNRTPPVQIKASDIKAGDVILARGEVAPEGKSMGAIVIVQLNRDSARRVREMQASFGKTWLMGRIRAIDGPKIILDGGPGSGAHRFLTNDKTEFRSRRQPVSRADLSVGEYVQVEGTKQNGQFVASVVHGMMPRPRGGPVPRPGNTPPQ